MVDNVDEWQIQPLRIKQPNVASPAIKLGTVDRVTNKWISHYQPPFWMANLVMVNHWIYSINVRVFQLPLSQQETDSFLQKQALFSRGTPLIDVPWCTDITTSSEPTIERTDSVDMLTQALIKNHRYLAWPTVNQRWLLDVFWGE